MRVNTVVPGKLFVPSNSGALDCTIVDISLGGASIECLGTPPVGTYVVLYAERFNRLPGEIIRETDFGVAILFDTNVKREYVAEKILLYLADPTTTVAKTRRSERVPVPSARRLTRENGEAIDFEIIDISLSGASFRTRSRPSLGELLTMGSTVGRVTRVLEQGVAVEFITSV
jgi:hypothetical protein